MKVIFVALVFWKTSVSQTIRTFSPKDWERGPGAGLGGGGPGQGWERGPGAGLERGPGWAVGTEKHNHEQILLIK